MTKAKTYIITLSCIDTKGIVAAVAGFLTENGGFIIESAQLGDIYTGNFMMRIVFTISIKPEEFEKKFAIISQNFKMKWQLFDPETTSNIVIMVSKQDHCLNDLLHRFAASKNSNINIKAVISNHQDVKQMVEWHGIDFYYLPVDDNNREKQEDRLSEIITNTNSELIVLARYMQILSPKLIAKYYGKIINIHHSFLPSFKGAKPYHQAFERGVKIIGATAHYASNDLDEGPIIEQEVTRVGHKNTPEDLVNIGRDIECSVLAKAVKYHIQRRVFLNGNKTVVF